MKLQLPDTTKSHHLHHRVKWVALTASEESYHPSRHAELAETDPLYGPAVRRKRFSPAPDKRAHGTAAVGRKASYRGEGAEQIRSDEPTVTGSGSP